MNLHYGRHKFFRFGKSGFTLYPRVVSGHVRHLPEILKHTKNSKGPNYKLMKKSFVLGVVLSLATVCFAGQKTFTIVLDKVTTAGAVKLAPGEYKVKIDGTNAVFTDSKYKSVTAPVKVETSAKKFNYTAVDAVKTGTGDSINAIEVGGTTTKLEFAKQSAATN